MKAVYTIISSLIIIVMTAGVGYTAQATSMTKQELFLLVNEERADLDYPPLLENPLLQQAAYQKAQALFDAQRFAHDLENQPFYTFIDNVGYHYATVGENLAIDYTTAPAVVEGWMNSPSHRANILNHTFEEMGIAITNGTMHGVQTTLVVQLFGKPKDAFLETSTISNYYQTISSATQQHNIGLAAFVMGTATVEAGTIMSYLFYRLTRRKKQ